MTAPSITAVTPAITIVVYGTPVPQGSKRLGRNRSTGKAIVLEDNKDTAPWREHVGWAARKALTAAGQAKPLDVPLKVQVTFVMPKPASAPKRRRTWPSTKPDIDKLQRAVFDAMTASGVWREDSRVQKVSAEKVYPGEPFEHGEALETPGVIVHIWPVGEVTL